MTQREARCAFSRQLARLCVWIETQGYEFAFDEVTERVTGKDPTSDHRPGSLHHVGLAADLLLYKDGKYLMDTKEYEWLGVKWEMMGLEANLPLRWGGRFKDGNHFSLEWQGKK